MTFSWNTYGWGQEAISVSAASLCLWVNYRMEALRVGLAFPPHVTLQFDLLNISGQKKPVWRSGSTSNCDHFYRKHSLTTSAATWPNQDGQIPGKYTIHFYCLPDYVYYQYVSFDVTIMKNIIFLLNFYVSCLMYLNHYSAEFFFSKVYILAYYLITY